MKDPASLVAHYPNVLAASAAAYALSLLPILHSRTGKNSRLGEITAISDEAIAVLRELKIEARLEDYSIDIGRFEKDLEGKQEAGEEIYPLVAVPSITLVDWTTGSFHVRPQTFLVSYDQGVPVFLGRDPSTDAVICLSLHQLRSVHRTWSTWPAVLPSMLLTVLWHRALKE